MFNKVTKTFQYGQHQVTLENAACTDVPNFIVGGEKMDSPGKFYVVDHLSAGLEIGLDGREELGLEQHLFEAEPLECILLDHLDDSRGEEFADVAEPASDPWRRRSVADIAA